MRSRREGTPSRARAGLGQARELLLEVPHALPERLTVDERLAALLEEGIQPPQVAGGGPALLRSGGRSGARLLLGDDPCVEVEIAVDHGVEPRLLPEARRHPGRVDGVVAGNFGAQGGGRERASERAPTEVER